MTELAYMVREDWAHNGTAMVSQSAIIREWVGGAPHFFAVTDVKKFNWNGRSADIEAVEYIAPDPSTRKPFNIRELRQLCDGRVLRHAVVVLHPYDRGDLEVVRKTVESDALARLFVLAWSPQDAVRTWLDGRQAVDLNTGRAVKASDPLMIEAAKMMMREEYNGLSSGRGKEAVVQLVRAFKAEGYAVDLEAWLRAYFAAGGGFRHAESIENSLRRSRPASGTASSRVTETTSSRSFRGSSHES
jgi:hypothetical protein